MSRSHSTRPPTSRHDVPFFRPAISEAAIAEVADTLRSGWLTTGPKTARFEEAFAEAVGARHAVALSSATAGLHLGTVAMGLRPGQAVLVPSMTFAATAEVVRYAGAVPILYDCDPATFQGDLDDAERKLAALRSGTRGVGADTLPAQLFEHGNGSLEPVGILPVHVGGRMLDLDALSAFAARHGLWTVEDAAHAFPAAWRSGADAPWRRAGEGTADVTCFSFYANKTITTGEGGMAVTDDPERAELLRSLSLHGLSRDAWGRYGAKGSWDYQILAPGYKYNLTDIAAAVGLHQLERAEAMRLDRERIAQTYDERLASIDEVLTPPPAPNCVHSWHLYPIQLRADALSIDRDAFVLAMRERGVGFSVHWRPLHLHPYWRDTFGWHPDHLPNASDAWTRTISLPLFPSMTSEEIDAVVTTVSALCQEHRVGPGPNSPGEAS